jgi:hypothetical protein
VFRCFAGTPMKTLFVILLMYAVPFTISAQSREAIVSQHALADADSLLSAFQNNRSGQYTEMSYPGVITYYGGIRNYQQYIERERALSDSTSEKTEIVQLLNNNNEWQCVIKKTHPRIIDGKKAYIVSYLVGQSTDNGMTWKYFDVAFNSVANIAYIMPDKFEGLTIPRRQVIFEKDQMASSK